MRSSILTLVLAATFCAAQQPCEKLADLKLPQTAITSAESVTTAPAHCVVKGITRPSRDSEIRFEVWLPPAADWNGRYEQAGNGGLAGSIQPAPLTAAVKRGYAAAGTDDGHQSGQLGGASWAIGHPEKLIDFGYRAVHETSVQAKAIVRAFYGKEAAHNYFFGCSDGGREALMEAERFPDDFDGIIAGAPANDWSHHFAGFIWNEQALLNDPASTIPASKLPAIQKAALDSCDALDGVKDNLIEDPRVCHFDPAVLACKGGDSPDCLTAPQVIALKKIYTGPKHPRTGK